MWGQFPVTKQEMAKKFAARKVLVLPTEDVCSGRLITRIQRVLTELSMLIAERPGLLRKAWKSSKAGRSHSRTRTF